MLREIIDQLRGRRTEAEAPVADVAHLPPGRPATLGWRGGTFDLRILNLSQHGMLGECDVELGTGDAVSIAMADGWQAEARVRWVRGMRFGAQITAGQGHALASAPSGQRVRRPPRFKVDLSAVARTSGRQASVQLRNVSAGGAMFEIAVPPAVGQRVELVVDGYPTLAGRIRWVRSSRVGLRFEAPLAEADFRRFADAR